GTRGTSPGEAAEAPAAKVTGAAEGAALSAWGRTGSVGGGGIWAGGGRAETLGSCGGEAVEPRKAGPGSAAAAARARGARGGRATAVVLPRFAGPARWCRTFNGSGSDASAAGSSPAGISSPSSPAWSSQALKLSAGTGWKVCARRFSRVRTSGQPEAQNVPWSRMARASCPVTGAHQRNDANTPRPPGP